MSAAALCPTFRHELGPDQASGASRWLDTPLRRQFLPHRGVDWSMADDLQVPHEFDALEQRQGRGRRGPIVTRELFVAQNGVHLGKVQRICG